MGRTCELHTVRPQLLDLQDLLAFTKGVKVKLKNGRKPRDWSRVCLRNHKPTCFLMWTLWVLWSETALYVILGRLTHVGLFRQ